MSTACSGRCGGSSSRPSRMAVCTPCRWLSSGQLARTARDAVPRWCTARSPAARAGGAHESRSRTSQSDLVVEVNPHDHTPEGGPADLLEPGLLEDLTGSDVQFAPSDLLAGLRDHRVRLERARAALRREADSCARARICQAAA